MPKLLLLVDKMSHNESEIETSHGRLSRIYLEEVDSTNNFAMKLLKNDAEKSMSKDGFLVTTSSQSSGKGQRGNVWSSLPGRDLAMTWVVTKPPQVGATVFNMAAALATGKGIRKAVKEISGIDLSSVALAVKWPNDVYLWSNGGYRKVAGILVENNWRGDTWTASLVGIGVNVMSRRVSRAYNAVSISEVINQDLKPQEIEAPILEYLLDYIEILNQDGGAEKIAREFNKELFGRNELREYEVGGKTLTGVLKEIDSNGLGVFEWQNDLHPKSKLHSSEVKWVFGLHTL